METFRVERLNENTIKIAKQLCDRYVGVDLYTEEFLFGLLDKNNHFFYLVWVDNQPMGYFYCYDSSMEELLQIEMFRNDVVKTVFHNDTRIGVYQSIGIEESKRKTNLPNQLLDFFQKILIERKCSLILVPCWKKGAYIPAKSLLERNGFTFFCNLITPWIHNPTLQCPYCKKENCVCDAALFFLRPQPVWEKGKKNCEKNEIIA